MSPEFAAAVCEGFCGSLEEVLSRELPTSARDILLRLKNQTEAAIEALDEGPTEVTCSGAVRPDNVSRVDSRDKCDSINPLVRPSLSEVRDQLEGPSESPGSVQNSAMPIASPRSADQ